MTFALFYLGWMLLCVAVIWLDMEYQIRRMDTALRASAYLDRVLPAPGGSRQTWVETGTTPLLSSRFAVTELRIAPFNPEDGISLHAAEGRGTYLAEADAVAILMGRATAVD